MSYRAISRTQVRELENTFMVLKREKTVVTSDEMKLRVRCNNNNCKYEEWMVIMKRKKKKGEIKVK